MIQTQALPDIVEAASDSERGGGERRRLQLRPQALAQDRADIDRCGLEEDIRPDRMPPAGLHAFQ